MLGVLAALAITLGLLILALKGLQRLQQGAAGRSGRVALQVLDRAATGPRQGVALVRVGERVLLVGTGDAGVHLLTELEGDDRARVLDPVPAAAPPASPLRIPGLPFRLPGFPVRALLLAGLMLGAGLLGAAPAEAQEVSTPPPSRDALQAPTATARGLEVAGPTAPKVQISLGQGGSGLQLDGAVGLVVFLGAMTLLPAALMLMTSFTRILIVLSFLRSALGTPSTPPTQLLVAIAVLLSGLVMHPVLTEVNQTALQPYFNGAMTQAEAYQAGLVPLRQFMLANTREQDLGTFTELSGTADAASIDEVPTVTVMSAFVTSELRTAFQMGFVIFLPFIAVDLIVASVLMSMGMFMLPPQMVSLPFKLLLFVLADGWTLVVQNLAASFRLG